MEDDIGLGDLGKMSRDLAYQRWPSESDEHKALRDAFYDGMTQLELWTIRDKDLKPEDVLIFKFKCTLPEETLERIQEYISKNASNVKTLVLSNGEDIDMKWKKIVKNKLVPWDSARFSK